MKLHLPKLLRNSVLACIAAVASVTTSVGTATYIGGTVAFVMAGQQAFAETTTLTEANSTYTYSSGNNVVVNVGNGNYATITINSGENVHIDGGEGFITKTSGKINLDITGASAVLNSNGGSCFIQGKVSVGSGGSLIVTKDDGTGYNGGQIPEIELNGGSLELAARQTFATTLSFKGNGTVKATDNEAFAHLTDGNAPSLEFYGNPTINVSGTGNKIEDSVAFYLRTNTTVNLQDGGELVVDSLVGQRGDNGPGSLTVTGTGALTFTNDSLTFKNGINLSGGTLTLGTATSTTTLGGAITMTGGTLVLDGAVVYNGTLDKLTCVEGEISASSNGLVDYDVVYHVLTGGANTGKATTFTYNNQSYSLADGMAGTKQAYAIVEGTVNVGGSSPAADTASVDRFLVKEGAVMNLGTPAAGSALTSIDSIIKNTSGTGTIVLSADSNIGPSGGVYDFAGTISVTGGTLFIGKDANNGSNAMQSIDLSKATIALDGGRLNYFAGNTTLGTVNVNNSSSSFYIYATNANANNQGTLTVNNLNIASGITLDMGVYWEVNMHIGALTGAGTFKSNNGSGKKYTIDAVTGYGTLQNNSSIVTLGKDANSVLNIGGTIIHRGSGGSLTVNGKVDIAEDLAGFTVVQQGTMGNTLSYNSGQDGYYEVQGTTYLLLDNQATKTEGEATVADPDAVVWNPGLTATRNGATVELIRDSATGDLTFVSSSSLDTIYHVNTQDITVGGENASANTSRATGFAVAEGRTVTIASAPSKRAAGELIFNSTGTGTIVLSQDAILAGTAQRYVEGALPRESSFAGTLSVTGGTLYLGMDGMDPQWWGVDLSSFKSIDLDGGNLRFFGANSDVSTIKVNKAASFDLWESVVHNGKALSIQEIVLNDNLQINRTYTGIIDIAKISGTGDISFGTVTGTIGSIEGCGALTNQGTLTIGANANSVLKIGGTISNTKVLTVNGVVTISDDLGKYKIANLGTESDTLSKGTDGYKQLTGATYLLLENTGAATDVTWNAGMTANYGDGTVTLTKDDATSNITFVGGSSWNTIYHVNTADITIGGENASDDTERATGLNVAAGRKVTIAGTVDAVSLLKNTTAAAGSTVVVDSELTAPIYLNADMSNLAGTLDIQSGRVVAGAANINSSGANFAFAPAKLIIGDGGEFTSNFGQNTATTPKELGVAIDAQSGAKLSNVDGHVKYNGAIRFNVEDPASATASYNNTGEVVYAPYFGKNIEFAGKLEGAGTVVLNNTQCNSAAYDRTSAYKISGAENTFAGTYKLADGASTEATDFIELHLQHANAAKLASVDLASTQAVSKLLLGSSAEIVGLYGSDADNVVQASGANATLTVSKGNYGGQLTNGGDTAVLSLTKKGTETLTLGGSIGYTGDTVVQGGKLNFTGSNALTLGNISLSNGGYISTASALTLSAGAALTMDMTGASTANALIGVGAGQLTLTDATCNVALSNLDDLQDGDYKLISWAAANNALTLDKFNVTGVELGEEYFLKVENNALILTKETAAELVWDATNRSTWAEGAAFAADGSEQVNFETKDAAVFNSMATGATEEAVTIKGSVTAKSVSITPGEGKSYTFTSHADGGQLATTKLEIGAGTVTFGAGSLKIEKGNDANAAFKSVTVAENGVLDLSALDFAAGTKDNEKNAFVDLVKAASGAGTIKISVNANGAAFVKEDVSLKTNLQTGDVRLNSWGQNKVLTITEEGSLTTDALTIESNAHVAVAGGKLNADSILLGFNATNADGSRKVSLTVSDGEVKTGSIAVNQVGTHKFSMSDGSLEITSADGFKSVKTNASGEAVGNIEVEITGGTLKAGANSWGITGTITDGASNASIGGATIETGEGSITIENANLTSALTNKGNLTLAGTINIVDTADSAWTPTPAAGTSVFKDGAGVVSTTENGFCYSTLEYTIIGAGSTGVTTVDAVTWKLNGEALATGSGYADGVLTVVGAQTEADRGVFYVNSGVVNYGGTGAADMTGASSIRLSGGELVLNQTPAIGITVDAASSLTIGAGVTLSRESLSGQTDSNKVTMKGADTTAVYALGSVVNATGLDFTTTAAWKGMVTIEDAVDATIASRFLNKFGNAGSVISINGLTGWLERDAGVAAHIILGEKGLTMTQNSADGGSNKNYIYKGGISGKGDFTLATTSTVVPVFEFAGNMAGWEGGFVVNQAEGSTAAPNVTVRFNGGGDLFAASGAKGVELNRAGTMNLTIGNTTSATTMRAGITNTAAGIININTVGNTSLNGVLSNTGTGTINLINNGILSLGNDTTISSLTNSRSITAVGKDIVVLGGISGVTASNTTTYGSITAGTLTLQGASNKVDDLILTGALTLGTADVASTLVSSGELSIGGGVQVNKLVDSLIAADSLAGGLTFNVDEALLTALADSQTRKVTLMTLTTGLDETSSAGVLLGALAEGGVAAGVQTSTDGRFDYTLIWNQNYTELTLEAKASANTIKWEGDVNGLWANADNWDGGVPASDSNIVIGSAENTLVSRIAVEEDVEISNLTVEDWAATSSAYTVGSATGAGSLTIANNLVVSGGALNLMLDTELGGNITVGAKGKLNLAGMDAASSISVSADSLTNRGVVQVDVGAALEINGVVDNAGASIEVLNGTLHITGDTTDTALNNTSGIMTVSGGEVTIDKGLNNTGGQILVTAGSLTSGTVTNAVVPVDAENPAAGNVGGSITIGGGLADDGETPLASMTVNGNLTNNGGSITIGSADDAETEADEATYGSLTVEGDLINSGEGSVLKVEAGSSLTVGGNLEASDMELAFGGDVHVGVEANIGTLKNDGSLTVGTYDSEGILKNGVLNVGSLSGIGSVTVGEDGSLNIEEQAEFFGSITNMGTIKADESIALNQTSEEGGKIEAPLVIFGGQMVDKVDESGNVVIDPGTNLAVQEYKSAAGTVFESVTTQEISFERLDVQDDTPLLTIGELTAQDTTKPITITFQQMTSADAVQSLIADAAAAGIVPGGSMMVTLIKVATVNGSADIAQNISSLFELTEYDAAYVQMLLQAGYKIGSELIAAESTTYGLRAAGQSTDISVEISRQSIDDSTWNIYSGDTVSTATQAGLTVVKTVTDGAIELIGADVLDNVQSVTVDKKATIDLTHTDTNAHAVQIHGLKGDGMLQITGENDNVCIDDIVLVADPATGNPVESRTEGAGVVLSGVNATLNLEGDTVSIGANDAATDAGTTLTGELTNGKLVVSAASAEGLAKGLSITGNSTVQVVVGKASADNGVLSSMIVEDIMANGLVDLGTVTVGDETKLQMSVVDSTTGAISESVTYNKYFANAKVDASGKMSVDRNTSYYSNAAGTGEEVSENGKAGLALADTVLVKINPQYDMPESGLASVLTVLDESVAAKNTAKMDELGAALAGASTAVLGMAVNNDVERQLKAIRNRTTTMGVDQSVANEEMPYLNAWINAEGDHHEMSEDGTLAGYKLSSWGGTVGFDVDVDPTFTAGMALTAMYGDLDATGADKATGELNSYYVTAFARYTPSAWTHTFVGTIGKSDISLERTVAGNKVEGDTNAMSFGLMYETGRVIALTEDGSTCLQPVFNVTWRHTTVDAYREKGGDHGLSVEEQTMDTVTFGLGARLQSVVGESMYNRTSVFECRVLAKADAGDRTGTSKVELAGATAEVDSAEVGAVGVEAGMGLTIPVGQEGGSIFMDASVDLRADYINANGTVGYRVNF